jgi:hypothetical protein
MTVRTVIAAALLLASTSFAQNALPRGGPGDRPDRPPRGDRPGGDFDIPPGDPRGGPPRGGPGGGGHHPLMFQVDLMRGWLDLIDRYTRLSRDPVAAGVAAVVSAEDLFQGKPPEEAIAFFNKMLEEAKNETVKRAIRMQLAELHGKANQTDKALEHLRVLMTAATATDAPPPPPPAPRQP